jgi:hypothetical protein
MNVKPQQNHTSPPQVLSRQGGTLTLRDSRTGGTKKFVVKRHGAVRSAMQEPAAPPSVAETPRDKNRRLAAMLRELHPDLEVQAVIEKNIREAREIMENDPTIL